MFYLQTFSHPNVMIKVPASEVKKMLNWKKQTLPTTEVWFPRLQFLQWLG